MTQDWRERVVQFYEPSGSLVRALRRLLSLSDDENPFGETARVLHGNLVGAVEVASIPALAAVLTRNYQSKSSASAWELLMKRALGPDEVDDSKSEEERWDEAIDGISSMLVLMRPERSAELNRYAEVSLRQATVLCWAGFEIAINDLLQVTLDQVPELITHEGGRAATLRSAISKSLRIGSKDLSSVLSAPAPGSALLKTRRIQSVGSAIGVYSGLLGPSSDGIVALEDSKLLRVEQDRHVIAHKAGLVDEKYLAITQGTADVGTELIVNPIDFDVGICQVAISALQVGVDILGLFQGIEEGREVWRDEL